MIVAYDLRYAADHFTGIGTHAYCLLEALLALAGPERYAVLWSRGLTSSRFDAESLRRHPRVEWIERPLAPLGLPALWRVGRLMREIRPAVYFSPFYFLPINPGCPCVLTLHDVRSLRLPGGLKLWPRTLYRLSLARAAHARFIVTASEFSKREIEELSTLGPEQVRVVRLGVPASWARLSPRRPAALPDEAYALLVGINMPHKNLATLASAWSQVEGSPPLRLVAAGPVDPRYPDLGALIGARNAGRVTSLGRVGEDELEWLYRNATLVLFPTLYEGFGLPMVEAFAHGAPVVASDIPPLREAGEGVARFVEPLDSATWAREVCRLAGDPEARHSMADAGRVRAAEFTYEHTARATLEGLREAAGLPAAVSPATV